MGRLDFLVIWMCVAIAVGELLGPESRKNDEEDPKEMQDDEEEIIQRINRDVGQTDIEYAQHLTEAVRKEIVSLKEYAEAMKKLREPKENEENKGIF